MTSEISSIDAAKARVAALEAELRAARSEVPRAPRALTFKVSEKGALSIYGMGRWPVTLYLSQFTRLIEALPAAVEFVNAHRSEFSVKED